MDSIEVENHLSVRKRWEMFHALLCISADLKELVGDRSFPHRSQTLDLAAVIDDWCALVVRDLESPSVAKL